MSHLKRLDLEEQRCRDNKEHHYDILSVERLNETTLRLSFAGPDWTKYSSSIYVVRCVIDNTYPFKPPKLYFEGNAPDHKFYKRDNDSYLRPNATTNLANTDFGLFYDRYSPSRSLIDFIKEIKRSLTPEGEQDMDEYMASYY
jgi:ubiquitin-protein ligase